MNKEKWLRELLNRISLIDVNSEHPARRLLGALVRTATRELFKTY